jgi:hypothetical protein
MLQLRHDLLRSIDKVFRVLDHLCLNAYEFFHSAQHRVDIYDGEFLINCRQQIRFDHRPVSLRAQVGALTARGVHMVGGHPGV